MADNERWENERWENERWVDAELVAALDPGIPARLLVRHPAAGWCRACHSAAPCAMRQLAEASEAPPP